MLHAPIIFRSSNEDTDFTINNQDSLNSNWTGGDPFYISVDAVDGLNSADISYEAHPLPNTTGEISGDVFRRGKTVTLTGTIWGRNLGSLGVGSEYLAHMFWETKLRKLVFSPLIGAANVYLTCRVSQDLSISQAKPTDFNYRWPWVIGLRADDPRMYNDSDDMLYRSWMT